MALPDRGYISYLYNLTGSVLQDVQKLYQRCREELIVDMQRKTWPSHVKMCAIVDEYTAAPGFLQRNQTAHEWPDRV
jgi:hypothetical protein